MSVTPIFGPPLPIDPAYVDTCLDLKKNPLDSVFQDAWLHGLRSLPCSSPRGALNGVTGHVAESLAECLLDAEGYAPLHHFKGPGRHGVDLVMFHPETDRVFAVEVKGTLRSKHWPRLTRGELSQMSIEWLDKKDNPGLAEWGLEGGDVYGLAVLVNFVDLAFRVSATWDFTTWVPVMALPELAEPDWGT